MSDQTLQANEAIETSAPVVEEKENTEDAASEVDAGTNEGEGVGESEQTEKPKKELTEAEKKAYALEKRIARMTAAAKQRDERMAQLEKQLAEATPKQVEEGPKESDFDSWEDFHKAEVEYKANKLAEERVRAAQESELKFAQQRKAEEQMKRMNEKIAEVRAVNPDYDNVIEEAKTVIGELEQAGLNTMAIAEMLHSFDNPPAMLYELSKDIEAFEELARMEPVKAMRELVKLEMKLENKPIKQKQDAPTPISPTRANGKSKNYSSMSGEQLLKEFGISR